MAAAYPVQGFAGPGMGPASGAPPWARLSAALSAACRSNDRPAVVSLIKAHHNSSTMALERPALDVVYDEDPTRYVPPLNERWTPLYWAIHNRHEDICIMLLRSGARADYIVGGSDTPLLRASMLGLDSVVAELIARGANESAKNCNGTTCLMLALEGGWVSVAQRLLLARCEVAGRETCDGGRTAREIRDARALICPFPGERDFDVSAMLRSLQQLP